MALTAVVVLVLSGSVLATLVALAVVQALATAGALRMVRGLEQPA
jgi:ABC-type thiamin/hydroxymethylpyrimidine transport system permease subunit